MGSLSRSTCLNFRAPDTSPEQENNSSTKAKIIDECENFTDDI